MQASHIDRIARENQIRPEQVRAVANLLSEGATVPFIARYRKEMTGSLNEVQIATVRDRLAQLTELDSRRDTILKSIREQEKLTPALEKTILAANTLSVLEDLYLPYKPKRRTRAMIARERGLEPLAAWIIEQHPGQIEAQAAAYISPEKEIPTAQDVLAGARDIIAEIMNEDAETRITLRKRFREQSIVTSTVIKGKEAEGAKYSDYFDYHEPLKDIPSHRLLAIRRGEREGFLSIHISPEEESCLHDLYRIWVKNNSEAADQVSLAAQDTFKRLLAPSLETEIRVDSKKKADTEAIAVFAENLRQLLLQAPMGQKRVLAIDPGIRTGCKVVMLDEQGKMLGNDVIYPDRDPQKSKANILHWLEEYRIEAIAIGNGTAGRETEQFVRNAGIPKNVQIVMVNEAGASIYSASPVARAEFPTQDVTVRGAISIGRRLMDPLAELVKIEPKSIGVGQYQHDVDQGALKHSLDDVVVSCVNAVGVEVNTASRQLLAYVSGLGESLADNIVNHRNDHGPFRRRNDLLNVARLGPKAFEQAAGFLRIRGGENPLDASAVHPERYALVEQMAKDLGCTVEDLIRDEQKRKQIDLKRYVSDTVGMPTLQDIVVELAKPGRDPRAQFEVFSFAEGVNSMSDLYVGMKLPGIVTNITAFGCFVDIGVHQDGLVHVSEMADRFVSNPAEVVKLQQKVMVTIMEVDAARKRISLSMKSQPGQKVHPQSKPKPQPQTKPEDSLAALRNSGMFRVRDDKRKK